MPLYAIVHIDCEGLHDHSCTLVEAASATEIAQQILAHPDRWKSLLYRLYPDDNDPCGLWHRIHNDELTPAALLALIEQTYPYDDWAQMLRIYPVQAQSLDQLQLASRSIPTNDPIPRGDGIHPARLNPTPTRPALPIELVLADSIKLRLRKERELVMQINQLKEHIGIELQAIQQHELALTAQQSAQLDQLRVHLAIDARSLLHTGDFQAFVHSMVRQGDGELGRALNPIDWHLGTLPHPLQLENIEAIEQGKSAGAIAFGVRMTVRLGNWHQVITIPIGRQGKGAPVHYDPLATPQQWIEVGYQLQQSLRRLPIEPEHQLGLAQELGCLLSYVGELFNLRSVADWLDQLQV